MTTENKFFIGIGALTILAIVAGAILLGGQSESEPTNQTLGAADQNELLAGASHTIGNPDAPVQVVEFADLQCPACRAAHPIVKRILETRGDSVYFVFRHYPLPIHRHAKKAAQYAEAVAEQGKFFEFEDKLFTNQDEWQNSGNPEEHFERYAKEVGLDTEELKNRADELDEPVENDVALGNRVGVQSTPTFFINGEKYSGVIQLAQFEQVINSIAGPVEIEQESNTSESPDLQPAENQ